MAQAVNSLRSVLESLTSNPSFTATYAATGAMQTLTIENNSEDRVHVRIPALGNGVIVEPGATGTIDAPINGTVLFVGLVTVTLTPESLDVAGQSNQLVSFRLLGRGGAALVTQESTYFFEREGVEAFEVDRVIVRFDAHE